MKTSVIIVGIGLAVGLVGSANAMGPRFGVDVAAYCGDPVATGVPGGPADTNVVVVLTNASGDNGPDGVIGNLTVNCIAAVQNGPGRPDQVQFASTSIDAPEFGRIGVTCPLESVPEGAHEWKATAIVSGGDLFKTVLDNCEEVPVN